jgi:hypothetical protein
LDPVDGFALIGRISLPIRKVERHCGPPVVCMKQKSLAGHNEIAGLPFAEFLPACFPVPT